MTAETMGYPDSLTITRPEPQSRLMSFPLCIGMLIRCLLAIPHFVILYFFHVVMLVVYFVATFAILFTGRFPTGMCDIVVGYLRWVTNVQGYVIQLYDKYPPFATSPQDYSLTMDVAYPETSSRLLNFPLLGFIIKVLILIPHLFVVAVLGVAAFVMAFFAAFAILFTGSFPEGLHKFVSDVVRWGFRVNAYLYALTDRYPPFSLSA